MNTKRRGLHDITSIINVGHRRRVRTPNEIFNDLARLNWEKMRLNEEKRNWVEKIRRIDVRLKHIEKLEKLLQQQMAQMDMKDTEKIAPDVQEAKQIAGKERGNEMIIKY